MAEIVNLRNVRKQKARAEKDAAAAANRLQYGRTKADKAKDKADKALATRTLDAHRREPK
jgi:hypothetical protein